jgi:phage I-like protein
MKQKSFVTALFAPEGNPNLVPQWKPGTELPKSLLVLRSGSNPSNKGTFKVNDITTASFDRVMRANGRDRVTIDFEHNTLEGSPAYKQSVEPRVVAGRGIPVLTPLGVEIQDIEWTKAGRDMAENYGDISPAPYHLEDGTVTGLHSVALVRNGAIYDLTFCSADQANDEIKPTEEDAMKSLITALSAAKLIPENGTETDVVNLITTLKQKADAAEAGLAAVTALTADRVKEIADECAKTQVSALTAEITGIKADGVRREKAHIIELAKFEGKVVALTADVIEQLTVEQLKDQISKIKPTVPMAQVTKTAALGADGVKPAVTEVQKAVAKSCGMDPAKINWG